ncbi:hypothetical protein FA95DRAFT_1550342, partial [Auriscalpium vulgare]
MVLTDAFPCHVLHRRNLACIGCGCPRPPHPTPPPSAPASSSSPTPTTPTTPAPALPARASPRFAPPHVLTPSGRAFALGGATRNVSHDPVAPCVVFWPDNEPLPEQGQIRPSVVVGYPVRSSRRAHAQAGLISVLQHPPILNTGNRGPIEHQPGDWVCRKCSYLNWRRRKVCQTCFPYAEGNGDSISAAVQAERIALLRSFLEPPAPPTPVPAPVAPPTLAPRMHARSLDSYVPVPGFAPPYVPTPRSRSYGHILDGAPIYQTSFPV